MQGILCLKAVFLAGRVSVLKPSFLQTMTKFEPDVSKLIIHSTKAYMQFRIKANSVG